VVELTHALLAVEDRDTLVLGAGMDSSAWGSARLASAPTRFGMLSVTFTRRAPDRLVGGIQGVRAPVRLRLPTGYATESPRGPDVFDRGDGWVVMSSAPALIVLRPTTDAREVP
jgi:hypothetical protein